MPALGSIQRRPHILHMTGSCTPVQSSGAAGAGAFAAPDRGAGGARGRCKAPEAGACAHRCRHTHGGVVGGRRREHRTRVRTQEAGERTRRGQEHQAPTRAPDASRAGGREREHPAPTRAPDTEQNRPSGTGTRAPVTPTRTPDPDRQRPAQTRPPGTGESTRHRRERPQRATSPPGTAPSAAAGPTSCVLLLPGAARAAARSRAVAARADRPTASASRAWPSQL